MFYRLLTINKVIYYLHAKYRQRHITITSHQRHTVFRESPKISDKSYTSTKEIQLHGQTKENWTYYFANKKSQR